MGMNDLLTVMLIQISGFYLLTVSGGDFDLTNLTRQSTSFIEYLKDAVRPLAHSKSTAFRQSIIQLRIAWTHLGPKKLGFPISWFIKLCFSVSKYVQLKIAMTFCARKIPWIPVDPLVHDSHDWQDYVGLLESIPQQYAQEQLLTPGSLSQVGAPEKRLQWVAAIHPWAVGW